MKQHFLPSSATYSYRSTLSVLIRSERINSDYSVISRNDETETT